MGVSEEGAKAAAESPSQEVPGGGGAPGGGGTEGEGVRPSGAPRSPRAPQEEEETCSEASFMSSDEHLSPEQMMSAAASLKEEGNELFKQGRYQEALDKYREGGKHLKKATASEAIAVSIQLSSNSCMCCLKLGDWQQAVKAADEVLSREPKNLKALYRRAVAKGQLGYLSEARENLMAVIAVDSANVEARKELAKIKEKIQAAKKEDRKAYSGLFSRAGGLYDDREEERERKKKEEEAERAKRRADWEAEMHKRREKGEEEEDFEAWLARAKEAEEREREEKQKQQAKYGAPLGGLNRRSKKKASHKDSSSSSSSSSSTMLMEIDDEDAAIIKETKKMGYCYFRRDLTEEEKRLNAENRPTKIDAEEVSPQSEASSNKDLDSKAAEGKSISQWNSRGTTYEEKDVSPWARVRFAERLQEAAIACGSEESASPEALLAACMKATEALRRDRGTEEDGKAVQSLLKGCYQATVKTLSVGEVTGDAQLAVVRGTRRVLFDLRCSLELSVRCSACKPLSLPRGDTATDVLKEGLGGFESKATLNLPEVSSADGSGMSWLEGSSFSFATPPSPLFKPLIDEAIEKYKQAVAEKIQAFLDDCRALP